MRFRTCGFCSAQFDAHAAVEVGPGAEHRMLSMDAGYCSPGCEESHFDDYGWA